MTTRPEAEEFRGLVFTAAGRVRTDNGVKARLQRANCERRNHTIVWVLRTEYGWWVAWRRAMDDPDGPGWEVDWADQVTGYTLSTCACGKVRRVDEVIASLVR